MIDVMHQLGGERALIHANDLIQMDPDDAGAFVVRGYIFHRIREWDKAFVDFDHAIDLDPQCCDAYFHRAENYYDMGLYEASAADNSKATLLDPSLGIGYFNLAMCFTKLSRDDEAELELARSTDLGYADNYHRGLILECREARGVHISK